MEIFLNTDVLVNADDWSLFHVLLSLNNADCLPKSFASRFAELKLMLVKSFDGVTEAESGLKGGREEEKEAERKENSQNDELVVDDDNDDFYDDGVDDNCDVGLVKEYKGVGGVTFTRRESERLALKERRNFNVGKKKMKKKLIYDKTSRRDKENKGTRRKLTSCSECPFKSQGLERMMRHVKSAHTKKAQVFKCPVCSFCCKWNRQYYQHLRDRHFPGPPHHCDLCGHQASTVQALLAHRLDHSDTRPYQCNVCALSFKFKHILETHVRRHTGAR